jgi:hypothetical protein
LTDTSSFVSITEEVGLGAVIWTVALWEWWDKKVGFTTVVGNIKPFDTLEEAVVGGKALAKAHGVRFESPEDSEEPIARATDYPGGPPDYQE